MDDDKMVRAIEKAGRVVDALVQLIAIQKKLEISKQDKYNRG